MGILWAVVDVLSAVAKAAVWVIEQADRNTKELHTYRFERQATEDQEDGDDD
jgi:hypothetical protein